MEDRGQSENKNFQVVSAGGDVGNRKNSSLSNEEKAFVVEMVLAGKHTYRQICDLFVQKFYKLIELITNGHISYTMKRLKERHSLEDLRKGNFGRKL